MSKSKSDPEYQHPKHDAIVALLRSGANDAATAAELKCDRRAVARVRRMLGMPPKTNATTLGDKFDRFTTEPDADGHVMWTGRTGNAGTPVVRHLGKEQPAARVAFERRTGRQPVGFCRSDCGVDHCMAPSHVVDDIERRNIRLQLRALEGLEAPWDVCPTAGHPWDVEGRVEPDLSLYCRACNSVRAARSRAARKEEATA